MAAPPAGGIPALHQEEITSLHQHVIGHGDDIPEPAFADTDGLTDTGQVLMPSEDAQEVIEAFLHQWEPTSADQTIARYRPILRRYWYICELYDRNPYSLLSLRDYLFSCAYPRIRYLRKIDRKRIKRKKRGHEPGLGKSSLRIALSAIARAWETNGYPAPRCYPQWTTWLTGLERAIGQPVDQKTGLSLAALRDAVDLIDTSCTGYKRLRDRAILLLGFHGAFRISELVGLDVTDIYQSEQGWEVWLASSKTDQAREGRRKPLYPAPDTPAYCPVQAYQELREALPPGEGPLLRSVTRHNTWRTNRLPIKSARQVITDATPLKNVSGHSLRIGFVTAASEAGASIEQIMVVTNHTTPAMPLHYRQDHNIHKQGPGAL